MRFINQRKMLFLYPENLSSRSLKEIKDIMYLSENLNFIVNEVNDFVKKISDKYLSKVTAPLPKVECLPVSDFYKLVNEFHNVRICLIKHNNVDYSSSYDKVVKAYENNQQDISHLISLTINSNIRDDNICWNFNKKDSFDVNIETNLNQLAMVLISIMMDIILYRHFNLSDALSKRKNFSALKRDYIININKNSDLQKYYKNSFNELKKTNYLSICYPKIFLFYTLKCITLDTLMSDLINDYWELIKHLLFYNIKLQDNYVMYDLENQYKEFPKDVQMQISDVIPSFCSYQNVRLPLLLAVKKESLESKDCHIVDTIDKFLNLCEDEFNYYKLDIIEV